MEDIINAWENIDLNACFRNTTFDFGKTGSLPQPMPSYPLNMLAIGPRKIPVLASFISNGNNDIYVLCAIDVLPQKQHEFIVNGIRMSCLGITIA